MSEQIANKLTAPSAISYARKGGNIMSDGVEIAEKPEAKTEGKKQENKSAENGDKSENKGNKETQTPAKQVEAEKAWQEYYAKQGQTMDDLSYSEGQTIRAAIEAGFKPESHEAVQSDLRDAIITEFESSWKKQGSSKEKVKPSAEWVMKHAHLTDIERLIKAKELFKEEIPEEYKEALAAEAAPANDIFIAKPTVQERLVQVENDLGRKLTVKESALLRAHYVGSGEKGKNPLEMAGVYNYTPPQLREKMEILDEAYDKDQRRLLIQEGLAAEPVNAAGITDPRFIEIAREINAKAEQLNRIARDTGREETELQFEPSFLEERIRRIKAIFDADPALAPQARNLLDQLNGRQEAAERSFREAQRRGDAENTNSWYLTKLDKEFIAKDAIGWLNDKFDQVFMYAPSGQAADSVILQKLSQQFPYVLDYLGDLKRENRGVTREDIISINRNFFSRINAVVMQTAVERGEIEGMLGAAKGLKAEGVGAALAFDDGGVNVLFNRMYQLMEDMRLREGGKIHHINSEMVMKIQKILMDEQTVLAKRGLGAFANAWKLTPGQNDEEKEEKFRESLLRSERTAAAVFIGLGELSILNARGSYQKESGEHRLASSPGATLPFNIENSLGQYRKLSNEEEEFFDEMKLTMADYHIRHEQHIDNPKTISKETRLELGSRLFRDIAPPADMFSSEWRTADLLEQLNNLFIYKIENAKILAAFANNIYADAVVAKEESVRQHARETNKSPGELDEDIRKLREVGGILHDDNRSKLLQEAITTMKKNKRDDYLRRVGLRDANGNTPEWQRLKDVAEARAKDFAMFMRLRIKEGETKEEKTADRVAKWGKVRDYRTEEIIRLFRERAEDNQVFQQLFNNPVFADLAISPPEEEIYKNVAEKKYDEFKRKYGLAIQLVREQSWHQIPGQDASEDDWLPKQVDFSRLTQAQRNTIDMAISGREGTGEGERLQQMFAAMQGFIDHAQIADVYKGTMKNRNVIGALMDDDRFTDIYTRSLLIDDTFIDELELPPANSDIITSMSKKWSSEPGKFDALVRYFYDINDGLEIQKRTVGFIQGHEVKDKIKLALEAAPLVDSLNGVDNRADYVMFTVGTLFEMCKAPYLQDVLGQKKMPFEWGTTTIQRLLGPHADPLLVDEMRSEFNKFKAYLKKAPRTSNSPPDYNPDEYVDHLEESLGVTAWWQVKKKTPRFLMYILLALIAEVIGEFEQETGAKKAG